MVNRIVCANSSPLETAVAIQSILWGIVLLMPQQTYTSSTVYVILSKVASENVLGIVMLAIGILQLIIVHISKQDQRRTIVVVSLLVWSFVDATFWLSGSSSTGAAAHLVTVLMLVWSLITLYAPEERCS